MIEGMAAALDEAPNVGVAVGGGGEMGRALHRGEGRLGGDAQAGAHAGDHGLPVGIG